MSIQTHDFSAVPSGAFFQMLKRTEELTANQRLIIMLYHQLSVQYYGGMVEMTAKELAAVMGMTPTMFSRIRQQLVDAGWLEQLGSRAHVKFYGLTPMATGKKRVLQLARPAD